MVYPHLSPFQARRIALDHFKVKSRDEMETYWYGRSWSFLRRFVRISGLEELRAAQRRGKGVLLFIGHYGSLGLSFVASGKQGLPINIVARSIDPAENPLPASTWRFNQWKVAEIEREVQRPFILTGRGRYPELREKLLQGEIIMLAIDTLPTLVKRTVAIQFLGRPAYFADGIANLHQETGASLVQWTIRRDPASGFQEIEFRDATRYVEKCGNPAAIVQALAGLLEEKIHRHPDHWHAWDSLEHFSKPSIYPE